MSSIRFIMVTLVGFMCYFALNELFFYELRDSFVALGIAKGISHIFAYIIVCSPILFAVFHLHKNTSWLSSLGLNKGAIWGSGAAFLATLPMFVGYGITSNLNPSFTFNTFLMAVVAAALFEEIAFRGFLFGQLFRFTSLGFIPSILGGALIFASVHLYQSQDIATLIGIFVATFIGALLFAWVYVEWNYNLWGAIFLHGFMNMSWGIFNVADNAFGDNYANACRLLTILSVVLGTIIYKRKKGLPMTINKQRLWMKAA